MPHDYIRDKNINGGNNKGEIEDGKLEHVDVCRFQFELQRLAGYLFHRNKQLQI